MGPVGGEPAGVRFTGPAHTHEASQLGAEVGQKINAFIKGVGDQVNVSGENGMRKLLLHDDLHKVIAEAQQKVAKNWRAAMLPSGKKIALYSAAGIGIVISLMALNAYMQSVATKHAISSGVNDVITKQLAGAGAGKALPAAS